MSTICTKNKIIKHKKNKENLPPKKILHKKHKSKKNG